MIGGCGRRAAEITVGGERANELSRIHYSANSAATLHHCIKKERRLQRNDLLQRIPQAFPIFPSLTKFPQLLIAATLC
jgi:hypothetical protein